MSTAAPVPETALMPGQEFSTDRALATLRRAGPWQLLRDAFLRFRYGDGFSHARALALHTCLSLIPLAIALIGLATASDHRAVGAITGRVVLSLTPGQGDVVDEVVRQTQNRPGESGQLALWLGLAAALVSLTTAMAQVERGANRIYGIQQDRPTPAKYGRALLLALTAGLPALLGFLLLVAGGAIGDAVAATYHWSDEMAGWWPLLRWPLGLLLTWVSYTVLLARAPHRRQPTFPWLAAGGAIAIVLWLMATALLAAYVAKTDTFRSTYGPLTSVLALLIWANLTAVALLFGAAFCAQIEAVRAGTPEPTNGDRQLALWPGSGSAGSPSADNDRGVIPPPRPATQGQAARCESCSPESQGASLPSAARSESGA
ncbi:MAG TPA: YihY/virulence factor BrkB family protein [Mycobacteriales bacterium]